MLIQKKVLLFVALASVGANSVDAGPMGTAFTYQGQLKQGGVSVNTVSPDGCDIEFSLWRHATSDLASDMVGGVQMVTDVPVADGLFTVDQVNAGSQFGPDAFNGQRRWLELRVSCFGDPFDTLSPRQELTPAPYAVRTSSAASAASVPWTGITGMPADFADNTDDVGKTGNTLDKAYDEGAPGGGRTIMTDAGAIKVEGSGGLDIGAGGVRVTGKVGVGTPDPKAKLHVKDNAGVLSLEGSTHAFINWYPDGYASGRKGWMGWGNSTTSTLAIRNEIPGASVELRSDRIKFTRDDGKADTWFPYTDGEVYITGDKDGSGTGDIHFRTFADAEGYKDRLVLNGSGRLSFPNVLGDKISLWGGSGDHYGFGIQSSQLQIHTGSSGNDVVFGHGSSASMTETLRVKGTGQVLFKVGSQTRPSISFGPDSNTGIFSPDASNSNKIAFSAGGTERMRLAGARLGIGTPTPGGALEVKANSGLNSPQLLLNEVGNDYARLTLQNTETTRFWSLAGRTQTDSVDGFYNDHLNFYHSKAGNAMTIRVGSSGQGWVGIGTTNPQARLDVNGTIRTKVLVIRGADLAEKFPTNGVATPGMVVAIDPNDSGKLHVAKGAYNRLVAGIVSGANGLSVGAVLGDLEGNEDAPAIALSGRVWVHCDATQSPIKPGDMMTTSDIPGHAMAASDFARAQGAILGKAMTALESGTGMVLVLVSLQ